MSQSVPCDPTQRWEWIKYQLRQSGTSLADLARVEGVSRNAMNNVKRHAYPRMERAIARALGMAPAEVWPERWSSEGQPHRIRRKRAENNAEYQRKHTPAYALAHVRNEQAEA